MEKDTFKTKVVFRKYKNGDIIALFPEIPAALGEVSSYQHIGGHGGADYKWVINSTKPTTKEEYMPLFNELEVNYGYQLDVKKRAKIDPKIWSYDKQ